MIDISVDRKFGVYDRKLRKQIKEITNDYVSDISAYKKDEFEYYSNSNSVLGSSVKVWELNRKTGKYRCLSNSKFHNLVKVNTEPHIIYIQQSFFMFSRMPIVIVTHKSEIF